MKYHVHGGYKDENPTGENYLASVMLKDTALVDEDGNIVIDNRPSIPKAKASSDTPVWNWDGEQMYFVSPEIPHNCAEFVRQYREFNGALRPYIGRMTYEAAKALADSRGWIEA